MKDIFVITCYQYNITKDLINLLGRENCYLVVDKLPDEYLKFKEKYSDIIISKGRFGYYSIDEALGRIEMMSNLLKVTKGDFDWVHVISQNDLPTAGFYRRDQILEKGTEYINICEFPDGSSYMSNYFTVSPEFCYLVESKKQEIIEEIVKWIRNGTTNDLPGAPSEIIWRSIADSLDNRLNDDLRIHVYGNTSVYGIQGLSIGHYTKHNSPLTLDLTDKLEEVMKNDSWFLFARKFDYRSPAYKWAYIQALNKYRER